VFGSGNYQSIAIEGHGAEHLIAFVREAGDRAIVTVATLRSAALLGDHKLPVVPMDRWQETAIVLPGHLAHSRFTNVFDDTTATADSNRIAAGTLLASLPVALLTCQF
jgi:(1->4)-alpha-D-glucan 1-alpha-D-glucosylmutase